MRPLTQDVLARAQCGNPGCADPNSCQLRMHGRCHPAAPTQSVYDKRSGTITVTCAECETLIAQFLVAHCWPPALAYCLEDEELEAFRAWRARHEEGCSRPEDAGSRYTWEFTDAPATAKVRCACGERVDITRRGS